MFLDKIILEDTMSDLDYYTRASIIISEYRNYLEEGIFSSKSSKDKQYSDKLAKQDTLNRLNKVSIIDKIANTFVRLYRKLLLMIKAFFRTIVMFIRLVLNKVLRGEKIVIPPSVLSNMSVLSVIYHNYIDGLMKLSKYVDDQRNFDLKFKQLKDYKYAFLALKVKFNFVSRSSGDKRFTNAVVNKREEGMVVSAAPLRYLLKLYQGLYEENDSYINYIEGMLERYNNTTYTKQNLMKIHKALIDAKDMAIFAQNIIKNSFTRKSGIEKISSIVKGNKNTSFSYIDKDHEAFSRAASEYKDAEKWRAR